MHGVLELVPEKRGKINYAVYCENVFYYCDFLRVTPWDQKHLENYTSLTNVGAHVFD